jgi:hypothetical protein
LYQVLIPDGFDLSSRLGLLRAGTNVLAIHGLNASADGEHFVIEAELEASARHAQLQYMTTPTPGATNIAGAVGFVSPVEFSVERGFFDESFELTLSSATDDAEIRFTRNGSTPSETNGDIYSRPLTIGRSSTIRAIASRTNYLNTAVTTHTYLFLDDVVRQSRNGQVPGAGWPGFNVNGQYMNYGMDPDIVDSARWSGQMRDALTQIPSISLVTDLPNLFSASTGIYVNARNSGRAWERRTSVELLQPDGSAGFATRAGLRIRGAFSRRGANPKHSFRLFFRKEYGDGRLSFPLFGGEGVDSYNKIDLRTSQNYSWAQSGDIRNTFIRDVFSRDAQRDMHKPYTRSRYYHLYLNGVYWGLFQTEERAEADFAESYLGGKASDYDVIKNNSSGSRSLEAVDGNKDAYRRLYDAAVAGFSNDANYRRVLGLLPDGEPDPDGEKLVDVENLMDLMACVYYTGDPDSPVSHFGPIANNLFAIYNRENPDGFKWFRHDAEHSLGAAFDRLNEGHLLTDDFDRSIGQTYQWFNPAWLHLRLGQNSEYAILFADRVNELFYNGGALSRGVNADRWMSRANQIDLAVIGASARWGDAVRGSPRTKDHWQLQIDWIMNTYFPRRTQIVIDQMRSVDMLPDQAFVSFSQHGGEVAAGFEVTMSQSNGDVGTIYFTDDGSDPRLWGGDLNPDAEVLDEGDFVVISETTTIKARVRQGSRWGASTRARFTVGLSGLAINEIMASNSTTLEDPAEPGEYPDWIELYNGSASSIDLSGMYLSDDPQDRTKWRIADGVSFGPGELLLFYADDDGTQGQYHTNFQLSSSGETLVLTDADGITELDKVTFDQQTTDVAYGRAPDGTGEFGALQAPTPFDLNRAHAP